MRRVTSQISMLVLAIMTIISAPTAWAAQTIVGIWAPDPNDCTPVGGMESIGSR